MELEGDAGGHKESDYGMPKRKLDRGEIIKWARGKGICNKSMRLLDQGKKEETGLVGSRSAGRASDIL